MRQLATVPAPFPAPFFTKDPKRYTKDEALAASLEYFNGDELASSMVVSKYLLRDQEGQYLESHPGEMHDRLATEFARIEAKYGGSRALKMERIRGYLDRFKKIIPQGSPQYGIGNNFAVVSLSNCVVVSSPEDDISSIVNHGKDLANLFKRRCGVGIDISILRPDGMPVSNSAGTTTGAWSFADFYSYICRMIGQNGRRGALMITIDVRHPDVERFITMKHDLSKVTGANVSVKIRDDFMQAVEADEDFELRWPVEGEAKYTRKVKARKIWNQIVESATKTAEPGLMMWDNIVRELPAECYADVGFKTVTTNPCGEIPLSPFDSCRLIAINLTTFVKNPYTPQAYFDFEEFAEAVAAAQRMSDDLVELELEKLRAILNKADTPDEKVLWQKLLDAAENGRRTGLGTLGLGDTMARLGLVFGEQPAIDMTDRIYEAFKIAAYTESVELAKERGAFPVFDWEKEKDNAFIKRLPQSLQDAIATHGRRNISLLTQAPNGSTSIEAQTSSGCEAIYKLFYVRRKKINPSDGVTQPDFIDKDTGDRFQEFDVFHHAVKDYWDIHGECGVDALPDYFITSDKISWTGRVEMQAAMQRHIDHSIASTLNLPAGTEPSAVDTIYRHAWKMGLKGVTVYVDGSRSGVLVSKGSQQDKPDPLSEIVYQSAPKRPDELPCEIHHRTIRGVPWTILVGLLKGKPYEVFAGPSEYIEIPAKYTAGVLLKNPRKTVNARYDLRYGEQGNETTVKNIVKWFEDIGDFGTLSRFVSMSLRHGVPVQYIVEQLQKDKNEDMWSFNRVISRVLKSHIEDGTKRDKMCSECDTPGLVYQEGCLTCINCGYAKCG